MKVPIAVLVALAVLIATAAPATAAPDPQVKRLQGQVKRLKTQLRQARASRDQFERQRNEAWDSVALGLPAQVASVASSGSISLLAAAIFEPVRVNWPCGATVFQGNTFWSLDVDLEDIRFDEANLECDS